jgi:hypothetical protein
LPPPASSPPDASAELAQRRSAPSAPSPYRPGPTEDAPDLAALNAWATSENLRDDLLAWTALALPLGKENPKTVSVELDSVESPRGATVTVIDEGFLDDSVKAERYSLHFSRKPCDDCESGFTPWWLWKLEKTYRCQPGRGQQEFSKALCR